MCVHLYLSLSLDRSAYFSRRIFSLYFERLARKFAHKSFEVKRRDVGFSRFVEIKKKMANDSGSAFGREINSPIAQISIYKLKKYINTKSIKTIVRWVPKYLN